MNPTSLRISVRAALLACACSYPRVEIAQQDARCDGVQCESGDDAAADAPAEPDASLDGNRGSAPCDMTGAWIVAEHTQLSWLGATQHRVRWFYQRVSQIGDRFIVDDYLNCGFQITGTTTISLPDATLAALAAQQVEGLGRWGTYRPTGDGQCQFALDVAYEIHGANRATYLTDVWNVGDPALPLTQFPALPGAPPGLEDSDMDGHDGVTLQSGLGPTYVTQRGWNAYAGLSSPTAREFGRGEDILVRWDLDEVILPETPLILRTERTPRGDGWVEYMRTTISRREPLDTCRDVQQAWQQQ